MRETMPFVWATHIEPPPAAIAAGGPEREIVPVSRFVRGSKIPTALPVRRTAREGGGFGPEATERPTMTATAATTAAAMVQTSFVGLRERRAAGAPNANSPLGVPSASRAAPTRAPAVP